MRTLRSGFLALTVVLSTAPLTAQSATSDPAPWPAHRAAVGGPRLEALRLGIPPLAELDAAGADTLRRRAKAVELSDAYAVRLKIHQIASFAELPLFAAEIVIGQRLARDRDRGVESPESLRNAHGALATGLGVLFGVNTITGGWNLIEGWSDRKGRTRRVVHSLAMLAADAAFLATAGAAPDDDLFEDGGRGDGGSVGTHRTWAISASALATAATLMMWIWKD